MQSVSRIDRQTLKIYSTHYKDKKSQTNIKIRKYFYFNYKYILCIYNRQHVSTSHGLFFYIQLLLQLNKKLSDRSVWNWNQSFLLDHYSAFISQEFLNYNYIDRKIENQSHNLHVLSI